MVDNINIPNPLNQATQPVQPPSAAAALQSFITGSSVPNVPQALLQLPPSQIISAVVVAANPKGQVLLQTPQGQVAFTSSVPLAVGQQLTLETLPRQAQPQHVAGSAPPPLSSLPLDMKLVRVNGVAAENVFPQAPPSSTNTPETAPRNLVQAAVGGLVLRAVPPLRPQQSNTLNNTATSLYDAEAVEYDPTPLQNQSSLKATVLNTPNQTSSNAKNTGAESAARTLGGNNEIPEPLTQLKPGDVLTVKITGGTVAPYTNRSEAFVNVTEEALQPILSDVEAQTTLLQRSVPNATPNIEAKQTLQTPTTNTQIKSPLTTTSNAVIQTQPTTVTTTPISPSLSGMILPNIIPPQEISESAAIQIPPTTKVPVTTEATVEVPTPSPVSTQPQVFESTEIQMEPTAAKITAPQPATPPSFNATVLGTVIGQETSGETVVQTPIATIRLPSEVPPLPRGTKLSLNVMEVERGLDVLSAGLLPRSFQTGNLASDALIKNSTSLDALFKQLFGSNAQAAKDVAKELIPQPGKEFGNKILQFISGVKEESLPETIRQTLPKVLAEQLGLNRVSQEFSSLRQAMTEAAPPQWNFMLVPVMVKGDEMQHMRWFKRKQPRDDNEKGKEGTRFVVEFETQSLGQIQLDGLFFNQPKTKQFDLVIRSNQEFGPEEQDQIAAIYNNYGEITGYRGSLRFEQASSFPVQPLNDILSGENREISA